MKKVFQLLNQMVHEGELSNYAIGGAIAAVFYVEPFVTHDVDVLVVTETETIVVEDWPIRFIPVSNALNQEAYLNAEVLDFEGEPVRVVLAEHLVAMMLQAGRLKDLVRVQMFLSQDAVDQEILFDIIKRHSLEKQWANFGSRNLP